MDRFWMGFTILSVLSLLSIYTAWQGDRMWPEQGAWAFATIGLFALMVLVVTLMPSVPR